MHRAHATHPTIDAAAEGRARPARRWRRPFAILAGALLLCVPVAVSASHSFTDVPDSNTFHNVIGIFAESGITKGCGATTFCPNDPVTRGQMAAFLTRGLGRMAVDNFDPGLVTGGVAFASVSPKAEGTAWLLASATFTSNIGTSGAFPCAYQYELQVDGVTGTGAVFGRHVVFAAPPGGYPNDVRLIHVEAAVVIDAGSHTVQVIQASNHDGTCTAAVSDGTLWAQVIPYSGLGGTPVDN